MKISIFLRSILLISLVFFISISTYAKSGAASSDNELQQVTFAERAITIELTRALSASNRKAKEKCLSACRETGISELAIGLIGISQNNASFDALVNLLGLNLDGAGSEELIGQICLRGEKLTTRLKQFKSKKIAEHCRTMYMELQKRELANVTDVNVEQVCRSEAKIKNVQEEWVKAIKSRVSCEQ